MVDGTGTTTYTYDPAGRLASYTNGTGQSLSYGYDLSGRETSITYPSSRTLTRSYDTADRLTGVTDWASRTTSFSYDADSNLTRIAYPNTVSTSSGYDQAGQLENIDISNTGGPLASFAYTHRDDGLLASQAPTRIPSAGTEAFNYDANDRISAVNTDTYGYDTADNPTLLAGTAQQFDSANQLCWTAPAPTTNDCATPPTGATTYTFDSRGNRTTRSSDVTAYGYDQANRLTNVTLNSTAVSTYTYDGDGLRQAKTIGATTIHQLWDTNAGLPLLALDGTDAYITGPGEQPLARIDASGTPTYIHADRQGSTRVLTDSTGTVLATYSFDAWGNTLNHTGTASMPLQYDGQYTDTETSLQYLRARYYDPLTGQFLTRDPVEASTRQANGYAGNNPTNASDPSGLEWGCIGSWCLSDFTDELGEQERAFGYGFLQQDCANVAAGEQWACSMAAPLPGALAAMAGAWFVGAGCSEAITAATATSSVGSVQDALHWASRGDKLDHIFRASHNLEPLVGRFGSREAVVEQMLHAIAGHVPAQGTFEQIVTIGGQTVVVRGFVADGLIKLGTAFTP